jgi:hypothetical protein
MIVKTWDGRKALFLQTLRLVDLAECPRRIAGKEPNSVSARYFFELQKNEVKRLKLLSRAQNRTLALNVKPKALNRGRRTRT